MIRCAVYTRKSTDEGLEQGFNTLDAQREACESYIKSQDGEGWRVVPARFDDGGFSGGSMQRPALTRLLEAVRARRFDAVVVYKVDRLTRSLTDFARIVELFDTHGVSFVSVTQQFNTTTSMGRLTLNVLLSFAQFEREVTAERIRDKIAASKKKGMWMGGVVPLGYDVEDKRLVVNAAEAENVRTLFRLYLEHGTVRAVQEEATRCGIVTRRRRDRNGTASGGRAFSRGNLYQLLANPLYVGLVRHRGQTYSGQHEAIVDRGIWEAVQRQLEDHARPRRSTTNTDSHALLTGLIFDAAGDRLRPTHASKKGRRYRYYVSSRLLRDAHRHGDGWRLPAPMLEATVVTALGRLLSEPGWLLAAPALDDASPRAIDRITQEARRLARLLKAGDPMSRGESVRKLVRRIELHDDSLRFELHRAALMDEVNNVGDAASTADRDVVSFDVPMTLRRRGVEAKLILRSSPETDATPDPNLIALLGQAHRWLGLLTSGAADSVRDIARRERANAGDVSLVLPLAFLAPDITEAILEGRQPPELTTRTLKRLRPLPTDWDAQRRLLGFGAPPKPPSHPNSHS